MTPALRAGVTIRADASGTVLEDGWTGFSLSLGPLESTIVRGLGMPRDALSLQVATAAGPEWTAEEVVEDVEAFISRLAQAGVVGGVVSGEAARRLQSRLSLLQSEAQVEEKLAVLLRRALEVPFHQERLKSLGAETIPSEDLRGFLLRLPAMTKADLRANFPERLVPATANLARRMEEGTLELVSTSGTTEERLQVLVDPRGTSLPPPSHALFNLPPSARLERAAQFTTPLCSGFACTLGRVPMEARIRGQVLSLNSSEDVLSLSAEDAREVISELAAYRPDFLVVHPWYAVCLGLVARRERIALPRVHAVVSSYQFLTARHRRLLRELFGAPVFSLYSATELGGVIVGLECEKGALHLCSDAVHAETLEFDGTPTTGPGRLTLSPLDLPHLPLLRYQPGDIASLLDEPCDCALGGKWRRFQILGREKDLLTDTLGNALTTADLDGALGDDGIDFYVVTQRAGGRYLLEFIPAADGDPRPAIDRLRATLGPKAELQVRQADHFAPERSMKFRQSTNLDAPPKKLGRVEPS